MEDPWKEVFDFLLKYKDLLGSRILDIGTGFSFSAEFLLRNTEAYIVSIDPEEEAIKNAELRLSEFIKKKRFLLKKAYAENLPFFDKYFDSVVSLMAFHHFFDPEKALNEIIRVSKNFIFIADWGPRSSRIFNPHEEDFLREKFYLAKEFSSKNNFDFFESKYWFAMIKVLKI